jgi:hypothetical protein
MKRKLGRPKQDVVREVLIGARFTADEALVIGKAVKRSKQVKSDWIRDTLLAAARAGQGN